MTISFNSIPNTIRVPGTYIEIDNSQAIKGTTQTDAKILVLGQRLSAGTVSANIPTLVTSKENAKTYFGAGSMLANMLESLFDNNSYTEKWAIAVDDNGAGVAATGTLTVTGPATAAGTINLYIGGVLVQASVASGDAQNAIATAINAAINADTNLPVTSSVSTNVVTITYRHKGTAGNELDVRLNYKGDTGGEKTPAGVSVAVVALANGATNPTLTSTIAAIPEEIYNYWVIPWIDSTSTGAIITELENRWGGTQMLEGHCLTAASDSIANLSTLGNSLNSQHLTILDASNDSPTPCYIWASALCGQVAFAATNDPGRPFDTLELVGIKAPRPQNRRTQTERNTLLYDGISTHKVSRDGKVLLERVITTYQVNTSNSPDISYLDVNPLFILSYFRQSLKARITQKYARHKLADDGTRFGAGQSIVTPKIVKAEIIALAGLWEEAGLLEDMDQFKRDLIVERNTTDRTRLDVVLPPNLVNPLHIIAIQIAFIV